MFDLSMGEIILVLIIALLVIGPNNLPKAARTLGRAYAWMRHHMALMQREINLELRRIELEEMEKGADPNRAPEAKLPPSGPAYDKTSEPEAGAECPPAPAKTENKDSHDSGSEGKSA